MTFACLALVVMMMVQPGSGTPAVAPSPQPQSSVQQRGHAQPLSGEVAGASFAGLFLKSSADDPGRLIAWDRVRTVDGPGKAMTAPFQAIGDSLMRARTRLERGDDWLADQVIDPLYRSVVESDEGFAGPSGMLLAECALRSCLGRRAQAGATLAWLQWSTAVQLRPRDAGPGGKAEGRPPQWLGGSTDLPSIIDPSTGLCPQLPPIFPHGSASSIGTLRVLTRSAELERLTAADAPSRALAAAYSLAVRIAAGDIQPGESVALPDPSSDAERLVIDVVAAQTAPSEPMRAARQRLQKRIESIQRDAETRESSDEPGSAPDRSWQRAWLHAAVGRSMLAEDQPAVRQQGMIELLHVPAIDGGTQPWLAATALLDVIDQLRRDNVGEINDAAIKALTSELTARFGIDPLPFEPPVPPAAPVEQPLAPAPAVPTEQPMAPQSPPSKEAP
ncbi:MAG: hypothetical protein Q8L55_03350 [Phycisphaerales bacterium]|nr:hypothetical protein [Phycisphaerales bacterium]